MNIGLRNANDLRKILLDLENGRNNPHTATLPDEESKPEVKAPEQKAITASIADVLAAQNAIMISTSKTQPVPNGKYIVPNGQVVIHNNEDDQIGFQFVGHGTFSLSDLKVLLKKGLVPIEEGQKNPQGINGEIDEPVSQGATGDCWILTGILSLTSTEEGKALIKASMEVQENGDVIVHFKGLGYSIRVTAAEIKKHDTDNIKNDAFSNGDNDMLVFELAVQKLFEQHPDLRAAYGYNDGGQGDDRYITQGGFGNDLVEWLSGNKAQDVSALDQLDDPYEKAGVAEWVTVPNSVTKYAGKEYPRPASISYDAMFNSDKTDFSQDYIKWYNNTYAPIVKEYNAEARSLLVEGLSEEEILAQLQEAFENQPCAVTFGMYVIANETVKTAKCVDGTTFEWKYYSKNVEKDALCGHAFAVVGMTQDTITFVNPWDSTQEITMTWEEFAKLGVGRMSYNKLDSVNNGENEPDVENPDIDDTPAEAEFSNFNEIIDYIRSDELKDYIKQAMGENFDETIFEQVITIFSNQYKLLGHVHGHGHKYTSSQNDMSKYSKAQIQQEILLKVQQDTAVKNDETQMFLSVEELEEYVCGEECYRAVLGERNEMEANAWNRLVKYIVARHQSDYARVSNKDIIEEMQRTLNDKSNAVVHGTTLEDLKNKYGLRDSEIERYFDREKDGRYYLKDGITNYAGFISQNFDGPKQISTIEDLIKYNISEDRKNLSHQYNPVSWMGGFTSQEQVDENGKTVFVGTGSYNAKSMEKYIPESIINAYFQKNENGGYELKDGCKNFQMLDYNQDTKIATYSIEVTKTDGEIVTIEFEVDVTTGELKSKKVK